MHLRASLIRHTPIVDDSSQDIVGFIQAPLINPDTGTIIGFFVLTPELFSADLFLSCLDIVGWGTKVHILSADRLSPPEDIVRLGTALADPRTFLRQRIETESSRKYLGVCTDVQFNTRHFTVDWLFPRRFFLVSDPISIRDVLEVTDRAIVIRDPLRPSTASEVMARPLHVQEKQMEALPSIP